MEKTDRQQMVEELHEDLIEKEEKNKTKCFDFRTR